MPDGSSARAPFPAPGGLAAWFPRRPVNTRTIIFLTGTEATVLSTSVGDDADY